MGDRGCRDQPPLHHALHDDCIATPTKLRAHHSRELKPDSQGRPEILVGAFTCPFLCGGPQDLLGEPSRTPQCEVSRGNGDNLEASTTSLQPPPHERTPSAMASPVADQMGTPLRPGPSEMVLARHAPTPTQLLFWEPATTNPGEVNFFLSIAPMLLHAGISTRAPPPDTEDWWAQCVDIELAHRPGSGGGSSSTMSEVSNDGDW